MRKTRLAKNTVSSLLYQVTAILCGFVLPRAILGAYGSEINGLVSSITQFLQIISFLDLGVSTVVMASLYKPLSDKDDRQVGAVLTSARKFFQRITAIIAVYICLLILVYPRIAQQHFGFLFTALLIASMSVSSFAQYYWGITDRILLTANQRGYIANNAKTLTLIANTAACVLLIRSGAGIHLVKLATSVIFLFRPIYLHYYVRRNYHIDRKTVYTGEPIKQKWNGLAQHIASVVLDGTDIIVLTVFSSLTNVSVYSVYYLVVHGVKQLFLSMTNGIHALMGELWARQELDKLRETMAWTEWCIHTGTVLVFGCTGALLVPFVRIYTAGISDSNYIAPLFGFLLTLAHAFHCLRLPYNILTLACGRFKETQSNYIIAAVMNIVISVVTVKLWGLIGVALGTLAAMTYQTIWLAVYTSKHLINWPVRRWVKQFATDITTAAIAVPLSSVFEMQRYNYLSWFILALKTGAVWLLITAVINSVFYRKRLAALVKCSRRP